MLPKCRCPLLLAFVLFLITNHADGQKGLVSEEVLKQVTRLSAQLPVSINEAYEQYAVKKPQYDSLEQLLKDAYPVLADKMKKRSARLNSMAGYEAADAKLSLMPPNQKMTNFFLAEWDRMDALERAFNKHVKSIEGLNELYKTKGYLPVWDSAYNERRPALVRYRDGILKLVQAEIAYLKAAEKMFSSSNEDERMQYVEAELSILQKLVLLGSKYKKVVTQDGVEKVQYCKSHPEACRQNSKS